MNPDQLTVVTLSSLAQPQRAGEQWQCGYYAANAGSILREEARTILQTVKHRKGGISATGFIGTNRLNSSAANRKLFTDRLEQDFVPLLQRIYRTEDKPTNLSQTDIEHLLSDDTIPVISSCFAARTVLRSGGRDPKIDLLLEQLAQDRFAVCVLNTTTSDVQGEHWIALLLLQPFAHQSAFLAYVCNSLLSMQSPTDVDNAALVRALAQTLRLYARTETAFSALFETLNELDHLCDRLDPMSPTHRGIWSLAFGALRKRSFRVSAEVFEQVQKDLAKSGRSVMDAKACDDEHVLSYAACLNTDTKELVDRNFFTPLALDTIERALDVLTTWVGRSELKQLTRALQSANWSALATTTQPSLRAMVRTIGDQLWQLLSASPANDLGSYLAMKRNAGMEEFADCDQPFEL